MSTLKGGYGDNSQSPTVFEVDSADSQAGETTRLLDVGGIPTDREREGVSRSSSWSSSDEFDTLPWWRKPSVFWLLFPYIVFTLAFGGIIVPKINLIVDLVCKQYFADKELVNPNLAYAPIILGTDNPQCQIPEVQSSGALFIMVMSLCTGILSIFIAPKMGQLSDRYGRTKLMALASCGGLVAEVITILAAKFPDIVDYRWLILGSVCDGLTGSFTAGSILSQAYTSDCTAPSKRAVSIGYIHACLFGGLAIGPLLAGYIVKWTGSLITIFYIVMGCHLFFIFCVGFVIPESLSKQRRLIAREKHEKELELYRQDGTWLGTAKAANPLEPLKVLWPSGHGTSTQLRINLVVLAFVDFVIMGCMVSAGPVIMLYTRFQFHWGTFETSNFISSLSMVRVVVLMGIFPIINYIFRIRPRNRQIRLTGVVLPDTNSGADNLDIWILRVALLSDIIGSVGYIFARSEALFYLSGMMTAVGGLGSATVQAVVTKHVPADRVGGVLGAIGMLHASTRVVGPLVFNGLYAKTVGHFTQAIFVLLVSIFTLGLVSSLAVRPRVFWKEDKLQSGGEEETIDDPTQRLFNSRTADLPLNEDQVLGDRI